MAGGLLPAIPKAGAAPSGGGLLPAIPVTQQRRVARMPKIGSWGGQDIGAESGVDQFAVDTIEGFNRLVASALDAPGNLGNYAREATIGANPKNPQEAMGFFSRMFARYGITQPEAKLNPIAESLGEDGLATVFGFGAAAKGAKLIKKGTDAALPLLERGSGRVSNVAKEMSETMLANPGVTVASEAGASVAGSGADQLAEGTSYETLARTSGNILGGGAVGVAASGARMTRAALPKTALLGETRDPSLVTRFAAENLEAEHQAIDMEIENMVSSMRRPRPNVDALTSERDSARLATRVTRQAEGRSRNIETDLWEQAATDRPMDNLPLQERWAAIRSDWGQTPLPPELARIGQRIERLTPQGTLSDLVGAGSIRSDALHFARRMDKSVSGGGVARDDLNNLQGFIIDSVRTAYPGDGAIGAAHQHSRWHNDRFWRDDSRLHPFVTGTFAEQDHSKLIQNLMSHSRGGEAVQQVSDRLRFTRLRTAYQRNIRDQFNGVATNWGKTGRSPAEIIKNRREAADWISRPETRRYMEDMPTEMADAHLAANQLTERMDARDTLATGAFNRIAQSDVGEAAQHVLTVGDKASAVREVMRGLISGAGSQSTEGDYARKLARNGFQAEVINRLFAQAQYDPSKLHQMITSRQDLRAMLSELLPGKAKDDFYSIVSDAMSQQRGSIAEGDISRLKNMAKAPVTLISRVIGARAGAGLGTGTIQAPAAGSNFLAGITEKYFSAFDHTRTLGRAVIDPHFRNLLHSTIPRNRKEHGRVLRALTLTLAAANAGLDNFNQDPGTRYIESSIRPARK